MIAAVDEMNNAIVWSQIAHEQEPGSFKKWLQGQLDLSNLDKNTTFGNGRINQVKMQSSDDNPRMIYSYRHPELTLAFAIAWDNDFEPGPEQEPKPKQEQLVLDAPYPEYAI